MFGESCTVRDLLVAEFVVGSAEAVRCVAKVLYPVRILDQNVVSLLCVEGLIYIQLIVELDVIPEDNVGIVEIRGQIDHLNLQVSCNEEEDYRAKTEGIDD